MTKRREYRLKIEKYTPETMPINRLLEYLGDLSNLFGNPEHVHLVDILAESVGPVLLIDQDVEQDSVDRIEAAKSGDGPKDAIDAIARINHRLTEDGTTAELLSPFEGQLLEFPGNIIEESATAWPTITQAGEVYGVPIGIGGKMEIVSVRLLDDNLERYCSAQRDLALRLFDHMWEHTIRATGTGKWKRKDGAWKLDSFLISDFETVRGVNLSEEIDNLRRIEADWKSLDDPLTALKDIRSGKTNGGL